MSWYNDHVNEIDADPELLRQLLAADAIEEEIQVVFVLRPPQSAQKFLTPDETERVTRSVLERVEKESGSQARDINIFRNTGSFVVQARPAFVRKLMIQDEILSALANRQQSGFFMPPQKKKPL
jgi:hypothetical protein